MSQGMNEDFVLHATVDGLRKFEQDVQALENSLAGLYSRIRESTSSNLGTDAIARMREEIAALEGQIASQKRVIADNKVVGTQKEIKDLGTPAESDTKGRKKLSDLTERLSKETLAAETAQKNVRSAQASFATATNRRISEEAKASEAETNAMLAHARAVKQQADQASGTAGRVLSANKSTDIDAEIRRDQAARARTAKEEARASEQRRKERERNAQAEDAAVLGAAQNVVRNANAASAHASKVAGGAKTTDIDAELRREEVAQTRAARERQKEIDRARVEAEKEDLQRSRRFSEDKISGLTDRAYRPTDNTGTGRLVAQQARQELARDQAEADLLAAKREAVTGVHDEAVMERRLASIAERRFQIEQQLVKTTEQLGEALKKQRASQEQAAVSAQMGPLQRARAEFKLGLRGGSDNSYAQQAGQAFKFSLLYGSAYKALFAVTQTFQAALQEGIDFQQGLSDLSIATGQPKEELSALAERLGSIASDAGASPAQGVQIGARAVGLYGLAGSKDADQQAYVTELSARVVSQMAMGNKGVDPVTLQQNIAAVTQALGLGAGGQLQVADLDTYFAKRFGSAPGDTLEASAQSASVGISAGFSLEQIQGLAALMIGRTGQSSNAVGGYLAQIFSRGGEGSLTSVADKYGVKTQGRELSSVFSDLSKVYNQSDPNQQAEISAAFGRGKVQNAVVAALQSWGEVAMEAKKAQGGAADGATDKAYRERLGNLGGQLGQLSGDFKEFAHLIGESGLLSALGGVIKILDLTIEGINKVLSLYNELNPAMRTFIALLLSGAIAGKVAGISGGVVGGLTRGELPIKLAERLGMVVGDPVKSGAAVLDGEGAVVAAQVGSKGVLAAGKAALATVGPWALAGAGLVAIADAAEQTKKDVALTRSTLSALKQIPGPNASPTELRNAATQLKSQAGEDRKSGDWLTQAVTFGHGNDEQVANAKMLEAEAKRLRALAASKAEAEANRAPSAPIIGGFDKDSLAAGLDAVTASGGTAADRVRALTDAINGLGKEAAAKATTINPQEIAGTLAASARTLYDSRQMFAGGNSVALDFASTYKPDKLNNDPDATNKMRAAIGRALPAGKVADNLSAAMDEAGVQSFTDLTDANAGEIAAAISKLPDSVTKKYIGVQDLVTGAMKASLLKQARDVRKAVTGGAKNLSNKDVVDTLTAIKTEFDSRDEDLGKTDFAGRLRNARGRLAALKNTRAGAQEKDLPALARDIDKARTQIGATQIERLEALRAVAVQNAKSQRGATRAGMGFVRQEIAIAVRTGDGDLLAQVISNAGRGAIKIAQDAINAAIKVARQAQETARAIAAEAQRSFYAAGNLGPTAVVPAKAPKSKREKDLEKLRNVPKITPLNLNADQYTDPTKGEKGDTAAQIAAARAAANAARSGSAVSGARAALVQARADLHDAKPGTVAYYSALGALYSAQREYSAAIGQLAPAKAAVSAARLGGEIAPARASIASAKAELAQTTKGTVEYYQALASLIQGRQSMTDALAAYGRNVRSLRIDTTDPVAQANFEQREAVRKLRRDARKGKDVKAEDRVAVRETRNQAEAAKFDQRLSDVQTADQLGRISHAAYLRYLQNEHNRLTTIGKRTRQQQDQLNQIDQLMLEASKSMQGAYNIGDIKLPTPYEVRRYVKEQAGLGGGARATTYQTSTVYVNGADTAMVKRVITETVGKNAQVMTVSPRRM